ncbi:MAG TPA: CU044_2847 family protein [Asanoa sp.]|nr:CU044_2847 family protein [Asanoa sp.]
MERVVAVRFEDADNVAVAVRAEQVGPTLVSDEAIIARLASVTRPIQQVGRELLDALKQVGPDAVTVEIGCGLAIEAGQLIALFGKGKGEASINVTLEWRRDPATP